MQAFSSHHTLLQPQTNTQRHAPILHRQISCQSEKLHPLIDKLSKLSKVLHFLRTINRVLPANLTHDSPDYCQHTMMKPSHLPMISHATLMIIQSLPQHSTDSLQQQLQMQAVRHPTTCMSMTQPMTTATRCNQIPTTSKDLYNTQFGNNESNLVKS